MFLGGVYRELKLKAVIKEVVQLKADEEWRGLWLHSKIRKGTRDLVRARSTDGSRLPADVQALRTSVEMVADDTASDHLLELVIEDRLAVSLAAASGQVHLFGESARVRRHKAAGWRRIRSARLCRWRGCGVVVSRRKLCPRARCGRLGEKGTRCRRRSRRGTNWLVVVCLWSGRSIEDSFDARSRAGRPCFLIGLRLIRRLRLVLVQRREKLAVEEGEGGSEAVTTWT